MYITRTDDYLEFLTSVRVKCTVIVQNVDELEFMADTDFVIIGIVRRCNLHGTCSELHVDGDFVGDNGYAAVDEGVFCELAVQVLEERKI